MTNVLRTTILLAALTALFLVIGGALGGNQGLVIAFIFALLMNFASYWFSDKIVLSMYRAREVSPQEAPDLYRLVQRLAQRAGIPMPRVYIIPSDAPNAFATGRNPQHGAVAVTEGIMRMLDTDELAGVLAHDGGGHPGRGHYHVGPYGAVGGDLWLWSAR
jgi:heat shock protein HtpX